MSSSKTATLFSAILENRIECTLTQKRETQARSFAAPLIVFSFSFLYFEFCIDGPFRETRENVLSFQKRQVHLSFIAKIAEEDQ